MKGNLKEENKLMPFAIANWRNVQILGIVMILAAVGGLLLLIMVPSLPILVIVVFIVILLPSGMQILYAGLVGKQFRNIVLRIQMKKVHFDILRLTMRFLYGERFFSSFIMALDHLTLSGLSILITCPVQKVHQTITRYGLQSHGLLQSMRTPTIWGDICVAVEQLAHYWEIGCNQSLRTIPSQMI